MLDAFPVDDDPAHSAVLLIDLQHRWAQGRSTAQLPAIRDFAIQAHALGLPLYWVGDMVGPNFHAPVQIPQLCPVEGLRTRCDMSAFLFNLREIGGTVIGKYDLGAFSNPLLAGHLSKAGIRHVYGCGYIANQCVAQTLIEARDHGFGIGMLSDLSIDNMPDGSMSQYDAEWLKRDGVPQLHSAALLARYAPHRPGPPAGPPSHMALANGSGMAVAA